VLLISTHLHLHYTSFAETAGRRSPLVSEDIFQKVRKILKRNKSIIFMLAKSLLKFQGGNAKVYKNKH
jgi:hypothetical protein